MRPGGQRLGAKYAEPGQQVGYWSTESRLSKVTASLMAQLGAALQNSCFTPLPPQHAVLVSQLEQWRQGNLAFVACITFYGAGFSTEKWGGVFWLHSQAVVEARKSPTSPWRWHFLCLHRPSREKIYVSSWCFLIQKVWTVSTSENWATSTCACLCLRVCTCVQRACSDVVRAQDLNYFPVWSTEHAILMYCQFCFLPFGIKFKMLKK